MKKLATVVFSFLLIGMAAKATPEISTGSNPNGYDGNAYIFTEGGVEFSVFADGQFDFAYVGPQQGGQVQVNVNTPNVNVSFNSGHDYEMYVQYDDYGAVIQVEDVPVYYDQYGRITQAGNVDIQYNDRRIVRVGGLHVNYDHYGHYVGYTGYINVYNRFYIPRPWHVFYVRPVFASCVVYDYPYRMYYSPVRYSYGYHRNHYGHGYYKGYKNARRDFYRPGSRVHYKDGRSAKNAKYNPNRRNSMVAESGRSRSGDRNSRATSQRSERGNTTTNRSSNNSRGNASKSRTASTSRENAVNNRSASNSRGTAVNKRNASTSRGDVANNRTTTASRGNVTNNRTATASRGNTVNKRSASSSLGKAERTSKATKSRSQNTRKPVAQNTRTASKSRSSKATQTNRSVSDKANTSRGGNSRSRGTTSRGGRG